MSAPKYFRVEPNSETLIFSAVSNINMLVEDEVREECDALLKQIADHQSKNVVIDLGALDYFGSIMLELMVVLWKQVHARGGKLVVCSVSHVGQEILKTAKFDSIWPILPTREEALASLGS